MPVRDETIDAALNAKTPEERKRAIGALMREWITTMPPKEKKAMIDDMTRSTVAFMQKLQRLQAKGTACKRDKPSSRRAKGG